MRFAPALKKMSWLVPDGRAMAESLRRLGALEPMTVWRFGVMLAAFVLLAA